MLSVLSAFRRGILEPLFEAVSPDVVWTATAPPEFFRFGGVYKGVRRHQGIYRAASVALSLHALEPKLVTAHQDEVWGLFDVEALHQPSGQMCASISPSAGR